MRKAWVQETETWPTSKPLGPEPALIVPGSCKPAPRMVCSGGVSKRLVDLGAFRREIWTSSDIGLGIEMIIPDTLSSSMVRVTTWPAWRISRIRSRRNSRGCQVDGLFGALGGAGERRSRCRSPT